MKGFFTSNLRLKLLALVFSFALWFFVAGQTRTEVGFLVPIGLKGLPKDLVMTSTPPDDIDVRVTGPKLFINNLSPSQITAELDLSGAREGLNSYKIQAKDIATPMGIDVQRYRPSSIEIRLERLIRVELPVKVRLEGKAAPGYRVADVIVFPRSVSASTARRDLKGLDAIYTKPVDISGMDSSGSFKAQIDTADYDLRNLSSDKVDVKVIVRKER